MLRAWRTPPPWERQARGPALAPLAAALAAAVAVGALVAPPVFGLLLEAGRRVPALDGLRDLSFESVASRCVLLALVAAGLAAAWRWRATAASAVGLAPAVVPGRSAAWGFGLGCLVMAWLWAVGLFTGAYVAEGSGSEAGAGTAAGLLVGALVVGLVEEVFFRGVVFGAMRRRWSFGAAACVSSLFYSLVHFARPEPWIGVAHAHGDSGLRLLRGLLQFPHALHHYVPLVVTLFLLGLALCVLFDCAGSLYPSLGLHAGIVFAMRAGETWLVRQPEAQPFWFGGMEGIAKSYAALAMALLVCLAVAPLRGARARREEAT